MRRYPFVLGLVGLTLFTPLAGWAESLTFITDFGINGRHAYFFVADKKGYYKEEGLDVTFVRGQGSADAIKKVAHGSARMGFADAGALVLARGNDKVPVKLVSIIYAQPPHAIYALEGSGIKTVKDLEGRKIADTAFSAVPTLFSAYAKASGVDPDKVSWLVADGSALPSLLSTGRVDAIGQFIVGEPLLEKAVAPKKLVRLAYRDAGLSYYGNGLVASEETIRDNPDTIRRFVAATLKGMRDAFANPDEAGVILHDYYRQVDADVAAGETRRVAELAKNPDGPGAIDPVRMQETVDLVSAAYEMKYPVKATDLYVDGFAR
ncbi:Membrane lipoprotein lipid attachment site [Alloalcanivorax dieselolei B5]|uniref:Thiamine pyrimidine synthase n=1 Tax=Alcanivorax dieselolei (strain DSM 16502 / CGMCC 1.3690 / MCCC 1A00001 / B-5) TaxID=930169 RepID=K0CKT5_ALCDB|nr:ABC transporter substrate-binding protein [Alloalcanivorax dieselolei]AFT72191.1 Membrane lipoprotein lipid attachment site [Alloalcanivorax dieselolei B5]GGJ75971.1 ABC transporter substrate-binding protein [Alloalcanivorax dieselolei]